ncbi:DUF305 domain-containing protein [Spongiactinospora sp. TRM90649]|uniref:DUF305 domain-containing protein n=1 Tax=Spongiactinospora sp. TRM90649 TaxID=3031114 RepID=UPI0023F6EE78|nr:DUF305 domain-containing protein [Spongiactinospora sp. TRM90649]MDF5755699.1 DUF305 domain-containing protein [Spongiactinospora sp. TRM90649]
MDVPVETPARPRRRTLIVTVCVVVAAAVAALLFAGRYGTPSDASPEAGFARDMAFHHAQAVEMAFAARDATKDERLRSLTSDIIITQTAQRGMFMAWLQQWGLNQAGERPRMAWMAGHGGHAAGAPGTAGASGTAMPGMASAAELERLRQATGKDSEILFLQLMIRHHEGGVQMADGLLRLSDREEVATMARNITQGQSGEIKLMTDMLRERGATPLPTILD